MTATDASAALAAIRAREQAATPGPWTLWHRTKHAADVQAASPNSVGGTILHTIAPCWAGPDAEFIAHARTDVPRLLDALERVLPEIDHVPDGQYASEGYRRGYLTCAAEVRAAITDALTT